MRLAFRVWVGIYVIWSVTRNITPGAVATFLDFRLRENDGVKRSNDEVRAKTAGLGARMPMVGFREHHTDAGY